jgi:hypothetical protein
VRQTVELELDLDRPENSRFVSWEGLA